METGAKISEDRKYRYLLWRIWDKEKPSIMFVGLTPTTADANNDDPTIRRCIRFAKDWGYGRLYMTNLFAYRATKPTDLKLEAEPIGPDNDYYLKSTAAKVSKTIFAWGTHGDYKNRNIDVITMINNGYCIAITKHGHPKHPLYISSDTKPVKFKN
jgi:hypothetical protein